MRDCTSSAEALRTVREILRSVLRLEQRADDLQPESELLGAIPELDSMTAVAILAQIEDEFGVRIEDDEVSAAMFATLGSLANFVQDKLGQ